MADETERKTGRKRIPMPDDPTTIVEVPCVTQITFRDPVRRQQDTQFTHDNSNTGDRTVHVDNVQSVEDGNVVSNAILPVERIDKWKTRDPVRRQQDTEFAPDNVTGNDDLPPHFRTHRKTQVIRYYEDPNTPDDGGAWIDIEWIDEYEDVDPVRRQQGRIFTLQTDPADKVNPDDPDITDSGQDSVDPPWRLSPWQNIVNWHSAPGTGIGYDIFIFRRYADTPGPPTGRGDWCPVSHEFWLEQATLGATNPAASFFGTAGTLFNLQTWATRNLRSDLINAFLTLSDQFQEGGPSNSGPQTAWLNIEGGAQIHAIEPGSYPPRTYIYIGIAGYWAEDDLDTGGLDGAIAAAGKPAFTPV